MTTKTETAYVEATSPSCSGCGVEIIEIDPRDHDDYGPWCVDCGGRSRPVETRAATVARLIATRER